MIWSHILLICHLDFAYLEIQKVDSVSYYRYHKINMQSLCDYLANYSFVISSASMATNLCSVYLLLGDMFDRHVPLIC